MNSLNDILTQMKQKDEQINAISLDELQKSQREKDKANMQADIDVSKAGYNSQISNTQAVYDKQIGDTKTAYESEYQKNAVQKLINEKKIAERNANLGLTDSGLNRIQQTAAQLSYANQKSDLDISRQNALDTLGLELTNAITTLQNQKAAAERDITNKWNSYSDNIAQNTYNTKISALVDERNVLAEQYSNMYNAQVKADAEVQKAAIESSGDTEKNRILYYTKTGYNNSKGMMEYEGSDGEKYYRTAGVNPYSNVQNAVISGIDVLSGKVTVDKTWKDKILNSPNASDTQKGCAQYGVFTNGYQPKGVCFGGKLIGAVHDSGYEKITDPNTGKTGLTVWQTGNGDKKTDRYWVWDGYSTNSYREIEINSDGEWEYVVHG